MSSVTNKPAKPGYWRSLAELEGRPEFEQFIEHEFAEPVSDLPPNSDDRRRFMQLMGASFAFAGLATGCRWEDDHILPQTRRPEGLIPGAVVIVGRSRGPVHRVVAGHRAVRPRREPMTATTIFDLASLTKVMATAPLVVEEATRGRLRLADPLERHLAETRDTQVGTIPLHRLLTHTANRRGGRSSCMTESRRGKNLDARCSP